MEPIHELGRWLSTLPYENITKRGAGEPRGPRELIKDSQDQGAGGTCFSLVNLAVQRAQQTNLDAKFYLGNRPDGENRHCVIGFPDAGVFLDPGYLCFNPLPLDPSGPVSVRRVHNTLHLEPEGKSTVKVSTERKNQKTWRYTLRTRPVSRDRFERAWRDSFHWESVMNSLVLTRLTDRGMLCYMNGRLETITREERRRINPDPELADATRLSELFGIQQDLLDEWNLTIEPPS